MCIHEICPCHLQSVLCISIHLSLCRCIYGTNIYLHLYLHIQIIKFSKCTLHICKLEQENFIVRSGIWRSGISSHLLKFKYTVAKRDVPVEEKPDHLTNSPKWGSFLCRLWINT